LLSHVLGNSLEELLFGFALEKPLRSGQVNIRNDLDDFFAAGCVLGKAVPRTKAPDLLKVAGRAIVNGEEAGRGTGADVLGHPHNALAWLANHLAEEGKGLHAGQIVLTGSLVKTVWLSAGDHVRMELDGLGVVEATFG